MTLILLINACYLAFPLGSAACQNNELSQAKIEVLSESTVDEKALNFAEGPAAKFSTTVNGRTHQQSPLVTFAGYQYATYFDSERRVCIARRKLPGTRWDVIRFDDHTIRSNDSHNTAVIGICENDGTIHMAFDHHASKLNYRVSKIGAASDPDSATWNAQLFSKVTHTLGSVKPAERVTYPRFFPTPDGNLMLWYRGLTSANGDSFLEEYDGKKHAWSLDLGKVIARDMGTFEVNGKTSEYRCAYMNSVSFAGRRLHASWIWRDRFEKTKAANQHDLCYAYSDDKGRTWKNSAGELIARTGKEFIHLNSPGLVVAKIPINSGLANQNTHFAYSDGSIHIALRHKVISESNVVSENEGNYHHYWRDDQGRWKHASLPLTGQRPKIIGTKNKHLFLLFNDEDRLQIAHGIPSSDRATWTWSEISLEHYQSIGGEPLVDLGLWQQQQILSIYGQEIPERIVTTQLNQPIDGDPSHLKVVDYRFDSIDE